MAVKKGNYDIPFDKSSGDMLGYPGGQYVYIDRSNNDMMLRERIHYHYHVDDHAVTWSDDDLRDKAERGVIELVYDDEPEWRPNCQLPPGSNRWLEEPDFDVRVD